MHTAPLQTQIVIVTGYSGAGKSTVLRALEDSGFFCVDNLPVPLFSSFIQLVYQSKSQGQRIALGIDVRVGHAMEYLVSELNAANSQHPGALKIFFLTASQSVLIKRFQETRRKHPLADAIDISDAILQEKKMLMPLMEIADITLDTDPLTIHQLRSFVKNMFATDAKQQMLVNIISFGFKYGVPPESNFVYDIRSLPNPYFVEKLRGNSGMDGVVVEYLFAQQEVQEYWQRLVDFVRFSLAKAYEEGRFFVTIAIGCTGGRHRSVAFVQELAKQAVDNVQFIVKHRDVHREAHEAPLQIQAVEKEGAL